MNYHRKDNSIKTDRIREDIDKWRSWFRRYWNSYSKNAVVINDGRKDDDTIRRI